MQLGKCSPKQIEKALLDCPDHHPKFCPGMGDFKRLCNRVPLYDGPVRLSLVKMKGDSKKGAEAIQSIKDLIKKKKVKK